MNATTKGIELGTVLARGATWEANGWKFQLLADGAERDYEKHLIAPDRIYIDDPDGQWFIAYNEDCYQPTMYVVRASSLETAYETFLDEFGESACGLLTEEELADYSPDSGALHYARNGVIDTEAVKMYGARLVAVVA